MRYQANPVLVNAFQITDLKVDADMNLILMFDNRYEYIPTKEMLSRITPSVGDYLVIQEDGYEYLNPKEVFERKYSKLE